MRRTYKGPARENVRGLLCAAYVLKFPKLLLVGARLVGYPLA